MPLVKVNENNTLQYNGKKYLAGSEVDLPEKDAGTLLDLEVVTLTKAGKIQAVKGEEPQVKPAVDDTATPEDEEGTEQEVDIDRLNKPDLVDYALSLGFEVDDSMNKKEIKEIVLAEETEEVDDTATPEDEEGEENDSIPD